MTRKLPRLVLLVAASAVLATNLALHKVNQELRNKISALQASQAPAVGSFLKKAYGYDLSGNAVILDFSKQRERTLFLVFSPTCAFSKANWSKWNEIMKETGTTKVIFADASGAVSEQYFQDAGIRIPASVVRIAPETRIIHNLAVTPTTLILGAEGKVEGAWVGPLRETEVKEIVAQFYGTRLQ